ncbi:conserved hypothetical protein [Leishmania major strain Friedlin]|uniref:Uncharacterized protein n=1 Tax=Leishmania major TaxID=5664 RepID=Q4QDM6_LEIMA|nr:conserved hypothetical protein [Leishmania major strain Friedlin]CAG9572551.1 hypothetical_protein_-_conserved [Leishmania major strain Friedlin]CAJ04364.1 conserved hypothetical protein [Leishmania major strain Friedlin]|eukprot:XP_001682572.1 conserved hypothetical protein [Leishmania major strain Friedlin]
MELTVGNRQVLLTAHKTYIEPDGLDSLRAFAQYPPLFTYLAGCPESGPIPDAVVVRRLYCVAHRITGALVDLVYRDACSGTQTERALRLTNAHPAALLPIVTVKGQRYALLARQAEVSQGLGIVTTAMRGVVNAEGGFASDTYASALERVGVRLADATPLSSTAFTIGNEGEPAIRLFTLTSACDEEQAEQLHRDPRLALVALKDVFAAGDAAASLAVSLISATA